MAKYDCDDCKNDIINCAPPAMVGGPIKDWLQAVLEAAARVGEAVRRYMLTKGKEELLANRALITDAALKLFDDYIAPLDIPYVPAAGEAMIDAALRAQLLVTIDWMFDSLESV